MCVTREPPNSRKNVHLKVSKFNNLETIFFIICYSNLEAFLIGNVRVYAPVVYMHECTCTGLVVQSSTRTT